MMLFDRFVASDQNTENTQIGSTIFHGKQTADAAAAVCGA